jgi:hypothetical protein
MLFGSFFVTTLLLCVKPWHKYSHSLIAVFSLAISYIGVFYSCVDTSTSTLFPYPSSSSSHFPSSALPSPLLSLAFLLSICTVHEILRRSPAYYYYGNLLYVDFFIYPSFLLLLLLPLSP